MAGLAPHERAGAGDAGDRRDDPDGEVAFTIDARAPEDTLRKRMVAEVESELRAIAERRGVTLAMDPFMDSPATVMDPGLAAILEDAAKALGVPAMRLASGAGHDAVAMATLCPVAMLFGRCKGGISHTPAESIAEADADVAVRVLIEAVRRLAAQPSWNR